jgi:Rieske Fe-S protein
VDPLRRAAATDRGFKRVLQLTALPPGVPREVAVRDLRQDAWTLYPEETVGRVWLLRKTDRNVPPEKTAIDAFTTVCPHLGCAVQLDADRQKFICPCHKAAFRLNGERLITAEAGPKNPAPRGLDALECRVAYDDEHNQWWVEVRYQKFRQGLTAKLATS